MIGLQKCLFASDIRRIQQNYDFILKLAKCPLLDENSIPEEKVQISRL